MSHNVLVTGASGFTGSWLAQRLARAGAKVVTILLDADPASRFIRDGAIHEVTHVPGTILDYERLLQTLLRTAVNFWPSDDAAAASESIWLMERLTFVGGHELYLRYMRLSDRINGTNLVTECGLA